uniref:Putative GPI-anchored protein LORELEI n=1 Tax=Davidia involucrata TaxID=16924 RepID=A0A5B7C481_DAVIN
MVSDRCLSVIFFFLLTGLASSSFISYDIYGSDGSTGRTLLQAKAECSVDFETMNYTILTSQCKGPQYPSNLCCDALKQFACPYSEQINDLKTNCAQTMFSYINLFGKYPPGLFANMCKEGKEGLACSGNETTSSKNSVPKSGAPVGCTQSPLLILTAGFLMLVFKLF